MRKSTICTSIWHVSTLYHHQNALLSIIHPYIVRISNSNYQQQHRLRIKSTNAFLRPASDGPQNLPAKQECLLIISTYEQAAHPSNTHR